MNLLSNFFKDDWQFFNYRLTKNINGFFYFLRKIPGLKKLISPNVFSAYDFKRAIGILLTGLSILFALFKKILVLAVMIVAQFFLMEIFADGEGFSGFFTEATYSSMQQGAFLWFFLVVIVWAFYNQFSVISTKKMIDFYTEFCMPRNRFILGQKFIEFFKSALFYLPAGFIYAIIAGKISLGLFFPLSYLAGNLIFFVFCRWLYMRNYSINTRRWIGGFAAVLFTGILGALYYFQLVNIFTTVLTSLPALVVYLILIVIFFRWSWYYSQQNEYITKTIIQTLSFNEAAYSTEKQNSEYIGQGLKMQKELQFTEDEKVEKLKGSDYLNALLFSRYRQVFNKKIRNLFIGFGVVALVIIGLRIANITGYLDEDTTLQLLPALFFLMYFISFGKQIVQMLFVNCDSSMLYYPFYREGSTILRGFTYRLRKTFMYNSIIVAGIFLLFVLLQVLNNFYLSGAFFGALMLLLLALSFLFSFHELFIYYLIQPFTSDMTVQSPLYKVITWVFYYFAYMNTQVHFPGFFYVIGISAICLLYVGIGLVIIYRVAPKTFKIKA